MVASGNRLGQILAISVAASVACLTKSGKVVWDSPRAFTNSTIRDGFWLGIQTLPSRYDDRREALNDRRRLALFLSGTRFDPGKAAAPDRAR